jgi:hypothetical protein
MAGIHQEIGSFNTEAQLRSLYSMRNRPTDLLMERLHVGIPVPGIAFADEISVFHG